MLSDDAFGNQLTDTKRALEAWAERHHTAAEIIIDEGAGFWRIQVAPSEASLCSVELVLRHDRCYDLIVLEASVEDQPIEQFEFFVELFDAIAQGLPVVRTYHCLATQPLLGTAMTVPLANGEAWYIEDLSALGQQRGLGDAVVTERRFAPY